MKELQIKKFGQKLMVASKSVNKIPEEYLKWAQNARIYDGGIGPAKGKQLLRLSTLGTNNKGAFFLNGKMYQITNSKIYEVNLSDGTQTEIDDLGYDERTDILTYSFSKGSFISSASETPTYNVSDTAYRIYYNSIDKQLEAKSGTGDIVAYIPITYDNRGEALPAIRIVKAGTDGYLNAGTGFDDGLGVILLDGQYINVLVGVDINPNDISIEVGGYDSQEKAIIASNNRDLSIFNGETVSTVAISNTGILEYCRGYSFLSSDNVLKISRPITLANPEYAYDFTGTGSQQIIYKSSITGLKGTMNGLYVFTKDMIEFLGANSLQNVAGSATFLSTPLGDGGEPINNHCIAASGDKIFYVTKNLQVRTINYIQGTADATIGELSARPIIGIKEFLNDLDVEQPTAFAFYNKNDNTIQFHLRTINSGYNDICLVYDITNDTYAIDYSKNYNYVIENGSQYYGFSDINSSIYKDDTGNSMAGSPIPFRIVTQDMNQGTIMQKLYGGFFTAGAIGPFTNLNYKIKIDGGSVFDDDIVGDTSYIEGLGDIGDSAIGEDSIGGGLSYEIQLNPFERLADEGRIFQHGKRIEIEISCESQIQDFIIDILGVRAEVTGHLDISDKF